VGLLKVEAAYGPVVVLAAVHGISVFLAEIGCIVVLAGWVADQVIRDLRQIRRARQARHR
jgi:hypothetical protein